MVVKPVVPNTTINASMPAPVSTTTGGSVIAASQARSATHNALVLQQSGRRIGGSKRSKRSKRSKQSNRSNRSKRSKRSDHKKRSKRSNRSKRSDRSKRSNRSKRGGENPTPTPSSKPVPVPQFAGAHNLGANANSLTGNHLLMKTGSQSVYDKNGTPSTTVVNG
jgi:hypothetical protein